MAHTLYISHSNSAWHAIPYAFLDEYLWRPTDEQRSSCCRTALPFASTKSDLHRSGLDDRVSIGLLAFWFADMAGVAVTVLTASFLCSRFHDRVLITLKSDNFEWCHHLRWLRRTGRCSGWKSGPQLSFRGSSWWWRRWRLCLLASVRGAFHCDRRSTPCS